MVVTLQALLAALVKVRSPTGDVVDERRGEDAVQHRAWEVTQLEKRHKDVDGGQRRTERFQLHHFLEAGEKLLLVRRAVAHPAEWEHQFLDHLRKNE